MNKWVFSKGVQAKEFWANKDKTSLKSKGQYKQHNLDITQAWGSHPWLKSVELKKDGTHLRF